MNSEISEKVWNWLKQKLTDLESSIKSWGNDTFLGKNDTAVEAKRLTHYYSATRPTSADSAKTDATGLYTFLATSSMTTNKPFADGVILNMPWDTDVGWTAQFFIRNSGWDNAPPLGYRYSNGSNVWSEWERLPYYRVGDVIITSSNTNPQSYFGGTWELIDKEFQPKAWTSRTVALNTTNCSACAVLSQHHGHTIELRITPTTKVALTDSTINIATFTLANFGVTGSWGGQERYWTQFSDGGNAIINWSFTSAGLLRSIDAWAISTSATHSVPAQALSMFNVTLLIPQANMLDSWCNKFYWKRTA